MPSLVKFFAQALMYHLRQFDASVWKPALQETLAMMEELTFRPKNGNDVCDYGDMRAEYRSKGTRRKG
jgi:hypothetical protein